MTTNKWTPIGTVKNWKGQEKDISIFNDDDTIAIGITEGGSSDAPFINQTFVLSASEFTTLMGLAVQAVNSTKIQKSATYNMATMSGTVTATKPLKMSQTEGQTPTEAPSETSKTE